MKPPNTLHNSIGDDRYQAFVRLLTQNERRVYAYIAGQVTDWNDADDILQETNVRLWEQFDRFTPGTDFAAWACTVARYQILTYRKTKQRSKLIFSDAFIEAMQSRAPERTDLMDARRSALKNCISKLSENARHLLRAAYEPRMKIQDVAKRIGRSPEATSKALQRMRHTLHRCIEQKLAAEEHR